MSADIDRIAENYANTLLRDLGVSAHANCAFVHPALRLAQCGLLALTGRRDEPAQLCPAPLASCADGVIAALRAIACETAVDKSALNSVDGAALLCERAACFGYTRNGAMSAGGSCRLLATADGWIALNLARDSDWELIPAWLESETNARDWQTLADAVHRVAVDTAVARGRLLGLAVCAMNSRSPIRPAWFNREIISKTNTIATAKKKRGAPLVVDLSSLWAGPLCSHLLQMLGARVIKVESEQRPDGARYGAEKFFDLFNAGKECVALNLNSAQGQQQLRQLLLNADIVIEASRPRALRHMHIVAEEIIAENPALTWVSITGYGREEPQANWIAFGDDAGVAAGLSQLLFDATGERVFCGDAIADPLTGMHATLAAWAGYSRGGGELISLSLCDVVAHCMHAGGAIDAQSIRARYREWTQILERSGEPIAPPRARAPNAKARALGADTQAIFAEFDIAC